MAENEIAMGQNRHCLETMFQCLEDYVTGYKNCVYVKFFLVSSLGINWIPLPLCVTCGPYMIGEFC